MASTLNFYRLLKSFIEELNSETFAILLSLKRWKEDDMYYFDKKEKKKKHILSLINSSTALRKIYDAYLDFYEDEDYDVKFALWIAKLAYQEKRSGSNLPNGITEFMEEVHSKLGRDNFKKFLEAFVAYHKYFNPKS